MALKILCAGCSKDEKAELESEVRRALSSRPPGEVWSVSLVKLGGRFSISVDGPERIGSHSLSADRGEVRSSITDLLARSGVESGASGSAPETPAWTPPVSAPDPPAWAPSPPVWTAPPAAGPRAAPSRTGPTLVPPPRSPSPAGPRASPPSSGYQGRADDRRPPPVVSAPVRADEGRDAHTCPSCSGSFVVTYEALPNEPKQLVAVACPHCWKLDHVEVAEGAAIARTYRADKLP